MRKSRLTRDLFVSLLSISFLFLGLIFLWSTTIKIPDLNSFEERRVIQPTKIYDRTGEILLYNLGENTRRTIVSGEEISRNIKNATVAIEDAEFYEHRGIKPKAILRAVLANILTLDFSQGGSTITQQVVKNSLLTREKKISRKLKEWVLSLKLEKVLTKDQILEFYLNESAYGGTLYGVEEASQAFFGKKASEVSLGEAAYLAAIPQAPTFYSPYGNHKDLLIARKNLVLNKMLENGFIDQDEFDSAKNESVDFKPQGDTSIKAPHFVFYIREYLENKYGSKALEDSGFKVTTTLDFNLQAKAEEIVNKFALENEKNFNAENAGLVAIDPKTGQILVMVGSRDYFDEEIDGNFNISLALRQPGSAFKPFVYATAFKKGYTPDTVLFDLKTQFSTSCSPTDLFDKDGCYSPDNYDNIFRGPMSLRNALAQSVNIPSVKTLYLAGITNSIRTSQDMGISTLEGSDRYGLTLVLGGGEVTLLDLTGAYGVFANDGIRNETVGILKIENGFGEVVEEYKPSPREVLDKNIARYISDILSDNAARTPAFGEQSYLNFPGRSVAAKTGTTNDYRDAWVVGYTPNISIGAWAGNNDNSPMEKRVAGFIIAPLWNAFFQEALKSLPNEPLSKPDPINKSAVRPILRGVWQGGVVYTVDKFSGKLSTNLTPEEAKEERVIKNIHSILYWVNKNDPSGGIPEDPNNDPQFRFWEYPVREWVRKNNIIEDADISSIPKEHDNIHTGVGPKITILGILNGGNYLKDSRLTISLSSSGPYPLSRADFYINENLVGSSNEAPFSISFVPGEFVFQSGEYDLKVVGYDTVLNRGEELIKINLN